MKRVKNYKKFINEKVDENTFKINTLIDLASEVLILKVFSSTFSLINFL
jgi:hypothetical protein